MSKIIDKGAIECREKCYYVCRKCGTDVSLRLVGMPGSFDFQIEPYCAHCGVRLIEESEQK